MCTGGQICPDKNEFTCDMQNSREFTCNGEESRELANSPRAEKWRVPIMSYSQFEKKIKRRKWLGHLSAISKL